MTATEKKVVNKIKHLDAAICADCMRNVMNDDFVYNSYANRIRTDNDSQMKRAAEPK